MAIVEFVNRPNRSYKGMKSVIDYVLRDDKAVDNLVSGISVNPNNAYNEFCIMKKIMGKSDKRLWYHFIQSFPPYDNVTPEIALEAAHRLAEYFKDEYQILISVHQDKEHIHTHFVMNTVNIVTGKKYTQNHKQMLEIQALSDEICNEYGLHVLSEYEKNKGTYKKPGEYRAEQNGFSWKTDLRYAIGVALQYACDRRQFIQIMKSQGYGVRWEDSRKNITFTTPTGMKCRDRKLGDDKYYNKANFEMIFEINANSKAHEEVPPIFAVLDTINAVMGGGGTDSQIVQFGNMDIEGLSYEDLVLLFKRLQSERDFARLMEELKARNAKVAASVGQLWENVQDTLRWYMEQQDSMQSFDGEFEEFFNESEGCR